MHPSKFFKEVGLRTGVDTFEVFDDDLKQKLMQIHPMNFIKTRVTLPVYKVVMSYDTDKGNRKETEKYMVMDSSSSEDIYEDMWADMFGHDYAKEHGLNNLQILDVSHICDAVLPIG